MANILASPGVSISVIDESIYVSSGAGTVPMIAIATASNKFGLDGSTIAPGTAKSNTVNLLTSQRDLLIQYGKPSFKVVDGTPVHGYETNEYGLMTAYSFLGLSNRAYVVRADVDLSQLEPTSIEPTSDPAAGTFWLDTVATRPGLFVSNAAGAAYGAWDQVDILVTSDTDVVADMEYGYIPAPGFGDVGTYAWVPQTTSNQIFYNDAGTWTAIDPMSGGETTYTIADIATGTGGSGYSQGVTVTIDAPPAGGIQATAVAVVGARIANGTGGAVTGYTIIEPGSGYTSTPGVTITKPDTVTAVCSGTSATSILSVADTTGIYAGMVVTGSTGLGTGSAANSVIVGTVDSPTQVTVLTPHDGAITSATLTFADVGSSAVPGTAGTALENEGGGYVVHVGPHYEIPDAAAAGEFWFKTTSPNRGFLPALKKYIVVNGQVTGTWHMPQSVIQAYPDDATADINGQNVINRVYAQTESGSVKFMLRIYTSSGWQDLSYEAGSTEPRGPVAVGTLWYDDSVTADIYRKGSLGWEPVENVYLGTDSPAGPSTGDIWVDTGDTENYPMIYEFDGEAWMMHDSSDQTTPNGCIFADITTVAMDDSNGGAASLIDENAPDPLFYPTGMLCWNSAVSTGNVKMWNGTYWQTESGNVDAGVRAGQPYMLRKAQRRVVVKRLIAALELPQLADETINFTLIATPGYPEAIAAMTNLNVERKQTAFVVGDSPLRLAPYGTSVSDWVNGVGVGADGEDGLTTHDTYSAIYYPSVLTTDLDGNNAVLPASYTVLRTYAYNDQVAYPWFAPAGLQRGVASNATNFGYVNMEHEFVPVSLNNGQRDNLYINKVNPLVNFPGQGLFVFGQKTQHPYSSALDRVNVVRLICYLRAQFEPLARPFLFEPNDRFTRANVRMVFIDFLTNMVAKRAIYDFLVVCDETNNTPSRIDANELYVDIAIAPEKAIEFIYIPIRVVNTGAIGNTVTAANLAAGA
jgi:hypothetical protein